MSLLALLTACGQPAPPPAEKLPALAAEKQRELSGHERMKELLAQIAERTAEENRYLGDRRLRHHLNELSLLPAGAPARRRWELELEIGREELGMGNIQKAIQHLETAHALALEELSGSLPPEEAITANFELAIAYLRLGETENCVAMHSSDSCILPIRKNGIHTLQGGSRQATLHLTEVLTAAPDHLAARWLLNIAHMTIGEYPDGVAEPYLIPPEVFASEEDFPRFTEVAAEQAINPLDLSGGAIVDDFDNDGLLDIATSTIDPHGQMRLFRNLGGGEDGTVSFRDVTSEAGLSGFLGGLNLVQADVDNDGDLDILVPRGAWFRQGHPSSLLRNNGDFSFTDITFESGLAEESYPNQAAAWADYDNDGDLDLYTGNEMAHRLFAPCQLYRNDGVDQDGIVTFTDVAAEAGVENLRYAKAVVWGDYNGDRWPDLYVSNRDGKNRLYRNDGADADGRVTFTDVAPELGVTDPWVSFNAWFWDFNNDGHLDLYVATYEADLEAVAAGYLSIPLAEPYPLAALYQGDGQGGFRDVAREQNLERVTVTMGSNFGDVDNDGYLDMYLGTGNIHYETLIPNLLYRNRGGTGFSDVTTAAGVGHLQKGHGVSFADLDNDGDQDIYIQLGGGVPGDAFGNALFENPGNANHWIKLRLIGVTSNRSAIGARIRLEVNDGETSRSIYRHVDSGGNFGANPLRQEIGVGQATTIDMLEVFWPTSNTTQVFKDVPVDELLEIEEGAGEYRRLPLKKASLR